MPRKIYIIENLDCANCAAKIEKKFNDHKAVQEAIITFSTKQLRLTAEDPDALIPELIQIAQTVERGAVIRPREAAHLQEPRHHHKHDHDHECGCGHHHEHEHDHECGCSHHHEHEHDHECGCGHHHEHEHDHECGCGHHHEHEHDHECGCGHHHDQAHQNQDKKTIATLILGAAMLMIGLRYHDSGAGWFGFLACLLGYVLLGKDVVKTALRNLTKGHVFDENFLMSIATIGAFCIGEYPEAVGVMLFYRVGEYFEHKAVERSRKQIMEAVDLRPEVVRLVNGEETVEIPAGEAAIGDLLLVRPGDRIPLDGVVVDGESRIDTAPITGEPVPVRVIPGDSVISGCVNTVGQLMIRVEKPLSESMVTRILDSVENAAASKPQFERFITRFARIYTPIVVGIAAATAIIPSLVTGQWNYWVYTALSFLVMSCPCALVLSVPLAFFAGIGAGSKRGILFKGGQSMEAMAKIKAVVFDKTGTLTKGEFKVQTVVGGMPVMQICASCEQQSSHPIAASIVSAAKEKGLELLTPEKLLELPGKGIHATLQGNDVLCGNARLLQERGVVFVDPKENGTKVHVAVNGMYQGYLVVGDTVKAGAEPAVRQLREKSIDTIMLTGDAEDAARAVAGLVGILEVHAGLLPQQKLEKLQTIRKEKGAAMFVGDGINDAPVLAGADVGAAMGNGADAAIEAADVVFMTSDVETVPQALGIAAETNRIAWQNVVFALAVKLIVMVLGLTGHASMWLAVFADSGVAMLCVLNSIRMLYKK
ncbi:MAG: heavy metal translocating P-type ATPase [Oscillospiraceae bacterium]